MGGTRGILIISGRGFINSLLAGVSYKPMRIALIMILGLQKVRLA